MPELPELQALAEGLDTAITGRRVVRAVAHSPAVMRTADPPLTALEGRAVTGVRRRGKLIVVDAGDLSLVMHLMQAGRLGLMQASPGRPGRTASLGLVLDDGRELRLRELSTHRRAYAELVAADRVEATAAVSRLGPEPVGLTADGWRAALTRPPGVLQNALRDGRRVAGVGRCYASEIMWAACLAPLARTDRLPDEAFAAIARAADLVLTGATERARERITTSLPDREARVTAVHGQYGKPCMRCGTALARVGYTEYELVYCPTCQTGGRVYADRRTSRFVR